MSTRTFAPAFEATSQDTSSWSAVLALSLCVATLIASEFMPVSLLTPIATDLGLTEGQAGQTIAVSGVFAVLTSLLISALTLAGAASCSTIVGMKLTSLSVRWCSAGAR
jgi:predicted MFS family arabinose efflux permease